MSPQRTPRVRASTGCGGHRRHCVCARGLKRAAAHSRTCVVGPCSPPFPWNFWSPSAPSLNSHSLGGSTGRTALPQATGSPDAFSGTWCARAARLEAVALGPDSRGDRVGSSSTRRPPLPSPRPLDGQVPLTFRRLLPPLFRLVQDPHSGHYLQAFPPVSLVSCHPTTTQLLNICLPWFFSPFNTFF